MSIDTELKKSNLQFWTDSYHEWKHANHFIGWCRDIGRSRKNLAKAIRKAEKKLNRPHRHLKALGCVQYIPQGE